MSIDSDREKRKQLQRQFDEAQRVLKDYTISIPNAHRPEDNMGELYNFDEECAERDPVKYYDILCRRGDAETQEHLKRLEEIKAKAVRDRKIITVASVVAVVLGVIVLIGVFGGVW